MCWQNVWIVNTKCNVRNYCDSPSQREVLLLVSLCVWVHHHIAFRQQQQKKKKSDKLHMTGGKASSRSQVYTNLVSFTVSAWFIWLHWGRWRQAESFLISFSIISTAVTQRREDVKLTLNKSFPSSGGFHPWPWYSSVAQNLPSGPKACTLLQCVMLHTQCLHFSYLIQLKN